MWASTAVDKRVRFGTSAEKQQNDSFLKKKCLILCTENATLDYGRRFYFLCATPGSWEAAGTGRLESRAVATSLGPALTGFRPCHSSPEKAGCGPVGSGQRRELKDPGAVRPQETLQRSLSDWG